MARSQRDTFVLVGLVIAALVLVGPLLMGGLMALLWGWGGWHVGMGPGAMGAPVGFGLVAVLFALVPLLLLAIVAVWAWRQFTGSEEDRALDELRMALARGDISEEEYERRRQLLDEDRRE